ncbi:MAG: M48 family metallopeptidase [Verrucomicrobia bacterium]|nr:M48 family metallopeptidase [Verrucomicrobiota bacterium]
MNKRCLSVAMAPGFLLALGLTGCATVGETGRKQIMLVSQDQEMQLGLTSFEQIKKDVPISKDANANALVRKVGQRIAAAVGSDLPHAQWEFVVFDSKEANAFCLPGGKIGVYAGILPVAQNEAGLATVIGHEVAHAAAHHGAERMSQSMSVELLGQLLSGALSASDPKVQQGAQLAFGAGTHVGYTLPHSRIQESEADRIGLRYMARAGYNPEEAVRFWERFVAFNKQAGGGTTSWYAKFLSTHPVTETRIRQLKEWLPEAKAQYRPAK